MDLAAEGDFVRGQREGVADPPLGLGAKGLGEGGPVDLVQSQASAGPVLVLNSAKLPGINAAGGRAFADFVAGPDGLTPGAIAELLEVAPSALSFHLKELAHSGLVSSEPRGRNRGTLAAAGPEGAGPRHAPGQGAHREVDGEGRRADRGGHGAFRARRGRCGP